MARFLQRYLTRWGVGPAAGEGWASSSPTAPHLWSWSGWNARAVTDHEPHEVQAEAFGRAAAEYERGRPPYPREVVDWVLPAGATRVLDLGAGTGKLTRQLWQAGLDVV